MGFFGKSLKKQLIDLALSKLKEGDQKDFDTYLNEIPESSSLDKEPDLSVSSFLKARFSLRSSNSYNFS